MSVLKIMIVEDTVLIRKGLRQILSLKKDYMIVGEAEHGDLVMEQALTLQPDIILMDIHLPGKNGIELTIEIKRKMPDIKVLALTIDANQQSLADMMKAGASGYVLKDINAETLYEAIETVNRGVTYIEPRLFSLPEFMDLSIEGKQALVQQQLGLTQRELEIINCIACGDTNREIAEMLFISEKTVKNHVSNILKKMGVEDRTQIAAFLWLSIV
jgi:DNA-binding NarL/FixJ family response regulator